MIPTLSKVKSSNAAISLAGKYGVVCGGTLEIGWRYDLWHQF